MQSMKSYEGYVLGLYEAMLKDIAASYPGLRSDCDRDYKRLLSGVEHHGLAFLCETLVAFSKHFDLCLDKGHLSSSGLIHMKPYKRGTTIPRLFKGLLLRVFHSNGGLLPVPDVQAIQFLRMLYQLAKSLKIPCPTQRTFESVHEFITTDAEVRSPSLDWDGSDFDSDAAKSLSFNDLFDEAVTDLPTRWQEPWGPDQQHPDNWRGFGDAIQRVADIVSAFIGTFQADIWKCRHGPGAVADRDGIILNKYRFPSWPRRLDFVFPMSQFAFSSEQIWAIRVQHGEEDTTLVDCETPSRLLAVPKTYRGPRLIAAEPTSHQWAQQNVRDFLMSRVKYTPLRKTVRFDDQSWNGELALSASHSGSHATIDLSQASDRISCYVVERMFRNNPRVLEALQASRTLWVTQDLDKKQPRYIKLRKFSTMGSAVTFPLQSILFSIVACASVLHARGRKVTIQSLNRVAGEVRVFGDDIIVPSDSWTRTVEMLEALGLRVNTSKTFATGKFRESCGVDAYDGHLVPKVNVNHIPSRTKPESVLSAVDCHNHLYLRGLWNAASYVRRAVDRLRVYTFPERGPDSGVIGWLTFDLVNNGHLKTRWNANLQRREYLVSSQRGKMSRVQLYDDQTLLQYFTECVSSYPFIEGERLGPPKSERAFSLRRSWVPLHGL